VSSILVIVGQIQQLGRQEERHHKSIMLKKKMDRYPEDTWRDEV
jgi:hypothetical protein